MQDTNTASGAAGDLADTVSKALRRAWQLGQTYWQQADSESFIQNKKSETTHAAFVALLDDTRAALASAAAPEQQPVPSAAVALSDDLRDRLVAISEAIADQDDRAAQAMLREILAAPQPCDSIADAVRVPLDSLHADASYLIGRLQRGTMTASRVVEVIRERIDAAKAALTKHQKDPS